MLYIGLHLRKSFQNFNCVLSYFPELPHSLFRETKMFQAFPKAAIGFLKIDHAILQTFDSLRPCSETALDLLPVPFCTNGSIKSELTINSAQSFWSTRYLRFRCLFLFRMIRNTYLYAFALIPLVFISFTALVENTFSLSQQTPSNRTTSAGYCCGLVSIGLHPFLSKSAQK